MSSPPACTTCIQGQTHRDAGKIRVNRRTTLHANFFLTRKQTQKKATQRKGDDGKREGRSTGTVTAECVQRSRKRTAARCFARVETTGDLCQGSVNEFS